MKDSAISTQEPTVPAQPSFQQLLSAAFIVQEHNDRLQSSNDPEAGYTRTLGEIVETERLIQDSRVDCDTALEIIAERTQQITRADNVAIGLIENGQLVYRVDVASGNSASQSPTPMFITEALAAECFRSGKVLQSPEAQSDTRISQPLRQRLGVESLLAVPIRQEGKIAGILEIRFAKPNGFQSQDARSCQLMAGLLGEVLTSKAKQSWKQALAANEEAAMAAVLEHIRPELDRFTGKDDAEFERAVSGLTHENNAVDLSERPAVESRPVESHPRREKHLESLCQRCGQPFVRDEAFCGVCGAMRGEDSPPEPSGKSPIWTSLWDVEPSADSFLDQLKSQSENSSQALSLHDSHSVLAPDFEDEVSLLGDEPIESFGKTSRRSDGEYVNADSVALVAPAPEKEPSHSPATAGLFQQYRATFYLAAALALLLIVIIGWATQPSPAPVAASATPSAAAPAPELSLMDKMLVSLGLAEAPAPPVDMGDPNIEVWEDIHTALYYCPGAELYGKTKDGKRTKQRDAQLDQFEPASRKACQ